MIISRSRKGFTLIELAIVLAVAGLLFVGLWRLLSGGNQQLRDQGAASQQSQLISAVKGFLASQAGQGYMTSNAVSCGGNCAASTSFSLPIPAGSACTDYGDANWKSFCNYLPSGFYKTTANSYGQVFNIRVLRDATVAGQAPSTYSFMIMTSGGDTIPDTSGGRITALIGNDGGFIYSTNVCGAPVTSTVCGAYGAWSASASGASPGYGFTAPVPASGTVASRTFVSSEQSSQYPWLDRYLMSGDSATAPVFNTMTVPFFLGGQLFYLGSNSGATTGGGTLDMQAGTINIQGGTIKGVENAQISLDLETDPGTLLLSTAGYNSFVYLQTRCSVDSTATANDPTLTYNANCVAGFQDHGDGYFGGRVNVNSLYATTFLYQGSDIRLKKNVRAISDPLGDVMKLKPVSFVFRESGKEGLGVIAQDLEKVYPQLVSARQDGIKSVNYEGLIAPLIGAVQELKRQNDELSRELQGSIEREKELERKLDAKSAP